MSNTADNGHVQKLGLALFYQLAKVLDEDIGACAATNHFLALHLETLGSTFVANDPNQCMPLLKVIVQIPSKSSTLRLSFTPIAASC